VSEFLDDLARAMALAVNRRDAIRVLFGAVAGAALFRARFAEAQTVCPTPDGKHQEFHCFCLNVNDKFFHRCCPYDYFCQCSKTGAGCAPSCPSGIVCKHTCCAADERCADPGKGLCCKQDETACSPIEGLPGEEKTGGLCCAKGEHCASGLNISHCCGPDQTAQGSSCLCPAGQQICGKNCCAKGLQCDGQKCCARSALCGGRCCDAGQVCVSNTCCYPGGVAKNVGKSFCCPAGFVSVGNGCCHADHPDCCESDIACLPGTVCVDGSCKQL
jgi:hypothetical protein